MCYIDGVDFPASFLQTHLDVSKEDCALKCKALSGCTYFTYIKTERRCYLVPKKGNPAPQPNVISGFMNIREEGKAHKY